jgi:hypothetical protein
VFAEEAGELNVERATAVGATESSGADAALVKAGTHAARRRVAAQSSLFDLANQKVVDDLRAAKIEDMSAEDAGQFLKELKKKLM